MGQVAVDDAGSDLVFDDANDSGAGAVMLVAAAAVAKVAAVIECLRNGDRIGAGSAARDAAEWLRSFGIAEVLPSDVLAECVAEVDKNAVAKDAVSGS